MSSVTLFDYQADISMGSYGPLASRMRPTSFDELIGQEHIVGPGRVRRKSIESDKLPSMILWGPPGSGKTSLAHLISNITRSHYASISAVGSGVADLRKVVEDAKERLGMHGKRTILFIDEIHRFNKSQQDVVLPHVESGVVTLIGATTENPSFEVISPLLSRSRVYTLKSLTDLQIEEILRRALTDVERGVGSLSARLDPDALSTIVTLSGGDARVALNSLELAVHATDITKEGVRHVTSEVVEDAIQRQSLLYDKAGDKHYDTISAYIKSVRGSDPDAAIYWLARMIEAGEDPLFISRRLVILAAEDIGLADPQALTIAVAAQQAVHFIGMPEGRIPLAEATIYLASAPKSNSAYKAVDKALDEVRRTGSQPVPMHLRNAVTSLMKDSGYGAGYKYAHKYKDHFTPMENLPEKLRGSRYYEPSNSGYERSILDRLKKWWGERREQKASEDS